MRGAGSTRDKSSFIVAKRQIDNCVLGHARHIERVVVVACAATGNQIVVDGALQDNGVSIGAACDVVIARATKEGVIARTAVQRVVAIATGQSVIACTAGDLVSACAAIDGIVVRAAVENVIAGTAGDAVITSAAQDGLVAR